MTLDIPKQISQLIASQFPAIYREDGDNLIAFVKAYYEFLESDPKYSIYRNRNLFETTDVDTTLDEFVVHFKKKYLADFPYLSTSDTRFLVKHIIDQYRSRGSEEGLKLFMRLAFGEDIEIYYPSTDIFKLSDSKWVEPKYIEVSTSERSKTFLGKRVYSHRFNASGVVETVITKRVNNKIIDVIYLSDVTGAFATGDLITDDGNTANSPIVVGSLTSMTIEYGGGNFKIGDLLNINSGQGKDGVVKVSETYTQTDTVNFVINDGGYGFTADANTAICVSDTVFKLDTSNTVINYLDTVTQKIQNVYIANTTGIVVGANVVLTTNTQVHGIVVDLTTDTKIVVNNRSGVFANTNVLSANGVGSYTVTGITSNNIVGSMVGRGNFELGVYRGVSSPQQYYELGYISVNGSEYYIQENAIGSGSGATFSINTLSDTSTVNIDTLFVNPYLTMDLANTNYGIVGGANTDTLTTSLFDAITLVPMTIGSISTLKGVNAGSDYDTNVYTYIENPFIAAYDYPDLIVRITSPITGSFVPGVKVTQGAMSGRVRKVIDNDVYIKPITFGQTFVANNTLLSSETGSSAKIFSVAPDTSSMVMGKNSDIPGEVFGASGTIKTVKIMNSGIGYVEGETVTMLEKTGRVIDIVRGTVHLGTSGKATGYWETKTSHIDEVDVRIRDNKYYQEYSYDVIATQSFDRYEKLIRNVLHLAGSEIFGTVSRESTVNIPIAGSSEIRKIESQTSYIDVNGSTLIANTSTGYAYVVAQTEVEVV